MVIVMGLNRSKVALYIPHTCDSSAAGFMKILGCLQ